MLYMTQLLITICRSRVDLVYALTMKHMLHVSQPHIGGNDASHVDDRVMTKCNSGEKDSYNHFFPSTNADCSTLL